MEAVVIIELDGTLLPGIRHIVEEYDGYCMMIRMVDDEIVY